jgi:hypothetical protein
MASFYSQEAIASPVIVADAYSREQDFEDGILVDASDVARKIGFSWPIAISEACWRDAVSWDDQDNDRKGLTEGEDDRLWSVLLMAADAMKNAYHRRFTGSEILFSVYRIPRAGLRRMPLKLDLMFSISFEGRTPVGTISLASELS